MFFGVLRVLAAAWALESSCSQNLIGVLDGVVCSIWEVMGLGPCCSPTIERGTMNRRLVRRVFVFLLAGLMVSSGLGWGASAKATAFDVRETTIEETQAASRAGKVTCREVAGT